MFSELVVCQNPKAIFSTAHVKVSETQEYLLSTISGSLYGMAARKTYNVVLFKI